MGLPCLEMGYRCIQLMLGAVFAAALLLSTAAAQTSKFDVRLSARRSSRSAVVGGGYSVQGAGSGATIGPRRSVLIRVAPGTPLAALRAAFPSADFGSQAGDIVTARAGDTELDALALDSRVETVELSGFAHPTLDTIRSSATNSGAFLGTIYGSAATDLVAATGAVVRPGLRAKAEVDDGALARRRRAVDDKVDAIDDVGVIKRRPHRDDVGARRQASECAGGDRGVGVRPVTGRDAGDMRSVSVGVLRVDCSTTTLQEGR